MAWSGQDLRMPGSEGSLSPLGGAQLCSCEPRLKVEAGPYGQEPLSERGDIALLSTEQPEVGGGVGRGRGERTPCL